MKKEGFSFSVLWNNIKKYVASLALGCFLVFQEDHDPKHIAKTL